MKECIYVIEDDENIREIIDLALTSAGYNVKQFSNALDALKSMENDQVDLAVFDLMLPGISGIDAIKKIRETDQEMPILILSAKDREIDKVNGLDSGSDDYMTKPFHKKELLARIAVQLRKPIFLESSPILTFEELNLHHNTHTVTIHNTEIKLTRTEYAILKLLMQNPSQIITKSLLLERISDDTPDCTESSLKMHISNLRKKLREVTGKDYIEAVWGIGFKLRTS